MGSRKKKRLTRAEQAAITKSPNPELLNRLFPLDEAFIEDFSNTLYNALQIARERGAMSVKRWIEQNDERRSPKQLASFSRSSSLAVFSRKESQSPNHSITQSPAATFAADDTLSADLKFITGNPSAADYFRAQAFTVATVENDRIRVALKDSLEAALRNGESFESWKKNANAVFDKEGVSRLSNRHLQVVFRTNAGLAYAAAQAAMMERQKSAFPFWQYSAVMDRRTRPSHAVLNGKIFLNGDWTYLPPLGFNCRCGMIPISAAKAARRGILAPSPVTPMELAGLASTEFMGEKNFKLMEWLRRQPLTKEAAEKIAPKTVILMAGISNSPRNIRDEISQQLFNAKSKVDYENLSETRSASKALFKRELTDEEFVKLSGVPDGGRITISSSARYSRITIRANHPLYADESERVIRKDEDGKLFIKNELLVLNKAKTEIYKGLGTRIFATEVLQATKLGVDYIKVFAVGSARNPRFNGYYTWARLGYDAELSNSERDSLKATLNPELRKAKTLLDLMKTEEGQNWWKENGEGGLMIFDLKTNSRSLKQLRNYLNEKNIIL